MNYPGLAALSMLKGLVVATATAAVAMASPEMAMEEAPAVVTSGGDKSLEGNGICDEGHDC